MTDNTQAELRGQLTELLTSMNRYFHTEPDERLVEFITAYTNKQVLAIIGEDEPTEIWYETEITVASGKKPVTKRVREKTYANAEVHHRNELRAEQRNKLREEL